MADSERENDGEQAGETQSAKSRYWLTNDAAALVLVGAVCGLMVADAVGYYGYDAPALIVQAFVTALLVSVVWLFGRGAAKMLNLGGGQ